LLLPAAAFAGEASEILSAPQSLSLTHHIVGYLSIAVTVLAYIAAMSEEVIALRKSKPMVWVRRSCGCDLYLLCLAWRSPSCGSRI